MSQLQNGQVSKKDTRLLMFVKMMFMLSQNNHTKTFQYTLLRARQMKL